MRWWKKGESMRLTLTVLPANITSSRVRLVWSSRIFAFLAKADWISNWTELVEFHYSYPAGTGITSTPFVTLSIESFPSLNASLLTDFHSLFTAYWAYFMLFLPSSSDPAKERYEVTRLKGEDGCNWAEIFIRFRRLNPKSNTSSLSI